MTSSKLVYFKRTYRPPEQYGPYDFAGVYEVAEYLGCTRGAIGNYQTRRGDFPQPIARLAMGPIFRLCDIRDWDRVRPNSYLAKKAENNRLTG